MKEKVEQDLLKDSKEGPEEAEANNQDEASASSDDKADKEPV